MVGLRLDGAETSFCRTYNQGVILGALAELSRATGESEYIVTAKRVADAGIVKLTNSTTGILHEPCEPDCGNDGPQFKGIYARNLRILQQQSPEDRFTEFLERNADSVWDDSRNEKNEFGLVWDRAFDGAGNASAQSSGLDIIVAALGMEVMGYV
jgi:predicted alpha-1,6-mannanase (GH76 family)